jgi:hypothetical protein
VVEFQVPRLAGGRVGGGEEGAAEPHRQYGPDVGCAFGAHGGERVRPDGDGTLMASLEWDSILSRQVAIEVLSWWDRC